MQHGRDFGGVPVGDIRVEVLHIKEELVHIGDARDVPVGILPNFFSVLPGFSLKSSTATFSEALSVKVPSGGASGGEGGASGGQFFSTHFLSFFSAALSFFSAFLTFFSSLEHLEHFFFSPPASTPVARRSEMRSKVMSFIVCALCVRVYLRTKAMAHDRTRAGRQRRGERHAFSRGFENGLLLESVAQLSQALSHTIADWVRI